MTHAPRTRPLAFRDIDDVIAAVRSGGGRLSASRRLVLEAIFAADGPVTAEHIAGGSGGTRPTIELTSVYRSLERLELLGVVAHVHLGHGPGLYALIDGQQREYLVCDGCDRVTAVEASRLDRARAVIREDLGYEAGFGHFAIHGLCRDCARGSGR